MKLKSLLFVALLFSLSSSFAQNTHKTKNVIIVLMDGYRWQELFKGADSSLLFGKKYNHQDSAWRMKKYWSANEKKRREKLMPFV
ncbi:MAG: hypothetical protein ABI359_01655 [Ginsengibacter sp.]